MKNLRILTYPAKIVQSEKKSSITGFCIIDGQHQRMFDLLNQVKTDLHQNADIETIRVHYFYFEEFSRSHIIDEEQFILRMGGQISQEHAKDHKNFLDQLSQIRIDHFELNNSQLNEQLQKVNTWLLSHISTFDIPNFDFINKEAFQYL